jgi:hypothetical protein
MRHTPVPPNGGSLAALPEVATRADGRRGSVTARKGQRADDGSMPPTPMSSVSGWSDYREAKYADRCRSRPGRDGALVELTTVHRGIATLV